MLNKYKDTIGNTTLILLLIFVSFVRISLTKIPYWIASLGLMYYSISYKYELNTFDKFIKREIPFIQRKFIGLTLAIYSALLLLLKLNLSLSYFIDPNNKFLNNSFIQVEILASNANVNAQNITEDTTNKSNIVAAETLFELLILLNSVLALVNKNHSDSDSKSLSNLNSENEVQMCITKEIYTEYKLTKIQKIFFFALQYVLISLIIIFNVSIMNLLNFLIISFMIISAAFNYYKVVELSNKFFTPLSLITLTIHYIKNIYYNTTIDNTLGIVNFKSGNLCLFFAFYSLAYLNSCNLHRLKIEDSAVNKIKQSLEKEEFKKEFKKQKIFSARLYTNLKKYTLGASSICYSVILLFWILYHVCILMFFNFLFLFFGINKKNDSTKYKIWFLYPTFFISIIFVSLQYIFNMTGIFIFNNLIIYKWLEIIGIYKYYKSQILSDYSNLRTLDQDGQTKIPGVFMDVLVLLLLMVFTCSLNSGKKIILQIGTNQQGEVQKVELPLENPTSLPNNIEIVFQKGYEWANFVLEKSFILCIFVLFFCSIVKFDLLHVLYFTFFVILLFVNESKFKYIWDFTLLMNSFIIIILLYFWNILSVNFLGLEKEVNPDNIDIFSYLGLKINKNSVFIFDYWEHIFLYLFGFLHSFLMRDKIKIENIYKFPEWSRIITLTTVVTLMIVLSFIKPFSFQGLFFLSFCLFFTLSNLFILSNFRFKIMRILIKMLIILSILIVIIKYIINFSFLRTFVKNTLNLEDESLLNSYSYKVDEGNSELSDIKYFSLEDLGLDSINLTVKLLVNALLILVVKILSNYTYYYEDGNINLATELKEEVVLIKDEKENYNYKNFEIFIRYCKVFSYQVIYLHSSKIMFILSVFTCVCLESIIGIIIFGVLLISLFIELKSGWRYSFFPLISISFISMNFIYICKLSIFSKWMSRDYEWFGLYNSKASPNLFNEFLPYTIIIISSYLTRIASTFCNYYTEVIPKSEEKSISRKSEDSSYQEKIESLESEDNKKERENNIFKDLLKKEEVNEIVKNKNLTPSESLYESAIKLESDSYFKLENSTLSNLFVDKSEEKVIYTLSAFWIKFDYLWYLYGFYIVLIAIMLVAFIKVNILSLIFMTFVGTQSFGIYIRTEYLTSKEENNTHNLIKIRRTWIGFAIFLAIFSFLQYLNFMWFPPSWKISKPWDHFSFFCSAEGKSIYSSRANFKNLSDYEYCVADWKAWLNIDNYSTRDIFFNFVCLFLLLNSYKYFTNTKIFKREKFYLNNVVDFTITENRTDFATETRYFLFIYLKSFILFYIIIISIVYSYRYTNLIYGGFMFISFYLLFKDAVLVKQKNHLWKYVQYYNFLVLVTFMLFQTPFLPCPVNRDGRSFISLEECVEEENRLYQSYLLYEYPKNKIDALYMVMVQTIGILKLDFKLLIVGNLSLFLIYIVALVQQIIFEHPYQIIVDNFYKREKQINCKSRAFKIVQDSHLNLHTEYRQLFTFMEILKAKLERLGKKIIEYGDLWKHSLIFSHVHRAEDEENEKLISDLEKKDNEMLKDKMKDEIEVMVDELFSNDKMLAGLLDYKLVKQTVELIRKEKLKEFNEFLNKEKDNLTPEQVMEIDNKIKHEILEGLVSELKNLFSEQFIKDKMFLYMQKDHGLEIAKENFKKMVMEEKDNPVIISSTKKEIELLKMLFSHIIRERSVGSKDSIREENNEEDNMDGQNFRSVGVVENDNRNLNLSTLNISMRHSYNTQPNNRYNLIEEAENNDNNNENNHENNNENNHENNQEEQVQNNNENNNSQNENNNNNDQQIKEVHHDNNENHPYLHTDSKYRTYVKRLTLLNKDTDTESVESKTFSYYQYIKKQLWNLIDKVLLIDLTSKRRTKITNIFELLILSIYTNIESVIMIAFILNHCLDASIMSMVYPVSYFGYGLVEYPFTNKYYWKTMTVYSLVIISIKLVYQFPFFCGYPFLAVFNIFNDSYCEYFPLSDQEITEGFDFILGLRKYNGEYSYPKNAGLLSGIFGDTIILCLLLVMRSLLKSKGIWNFVNINKEFDKVPSFESAKKPENQNANNNSQTLKSKLEYYFYLFLNRLVPELFPKDNTIIYKPGVDYYPLSFAALLTILIYTLFFFGSLTGKSSQGISDALDKQQFSKDLVWTVIIIMFVIVADRIIYKLRSINNEFIFDKFKKIEETQMEEVDKIGLVKNRKSSVQDGNNNANFNNEQLYGMFTNNRDINSINNERDHINTSNSALMTKIWLHYITLISAHILIFLVIPLSTRICFFNNSSLVILYLICCIYFYLSSKQIKHGFPLVTKGQYFADSTQLSNRILFKIYRNVPFLYELRAILDWTITKTSLDLFQFFKMECAYANLYEVKCDMAMRSRRRIGEDRWWFEKISWGLCSFLFLMFILILPMILFSSFNPNLVENKVFGGSFKINLELKSPEFPFFTNYNLNLVDVNNLKINNLKESDEYDYVKTFLLSHIDDIEERKLQRVKVINYSQMDWILSPPAINALLKQLEKKTDCFINIEWEFKREFPMNSKSISGGKSIKLSRDEIATLRNIIFALKNHQKPEKYSMEIKDAFPKVIRLSNRQWKYVKFDPKHKTPHKENTDLLIQLIKDNERDIYWKIHQLDIKDLKSCKIIIFYF